MVALRRCARLHGVAQAAQRRGHRRGHDAERNSCGEAFGTPSSGLGRCDAQRGPVAARHRGDALALLDGRQELGTTGGRAGPCGGDVSTRSHLLGPVSESQRKQRRLRSHWRILEHAKSLRVGLQWPWRQGIGRPRAAMERVHHWWCEGFGLQGLAPGGRPGGSHLERPPPPGLRRLPATPPAAAAGAARNAGEFSRCIWSASAVDVEDAKGNRGAP
mmetsp:Transcript_16715/g.28459  ORF Transcript_16715/g.28459 Transcript_16715/m.28459 type:complete len:217 (-) Transcript_16715:212-862(-)